MALGGLLIALIIPGAAGAQVIEIVSVNFAGQLDPDADVGGWALDATGRFIAFTTSSSFPVPNFPDPCFSKQLYVRDRATGTIQCVPNAGESIVTISADGRRVAYDTGGFEAQVYVYDLVDKTATLASGSPTGQLGAGGASFGAALSADGRVVAFDSYATNLAAPCEIGEGIAVDVFVRDLVAGTTRCVDISPDGSESGNGVPGYPSLSGDGRLVAFDSGASNLGSCVDALFQRGHVFVRDRVAGTTTCVDVAPDGSPGDGNADLAVISANGRFVAFRSDAANLAPPCGGVHVGFYLIKHVYVRDLLLGTTVCASSGPAGPGNDSSASSSLSADGRFVAFDSDASNLAAPCTGSQVYVRDLAFGTLACISVSAAGIPGNNHSDSPVLSGDGRFVAFGSKASNLLPGLTGQRFELLLARVPQADLTLGVNRSSFGAGDTLVATATLTSGPGPVDGYVVLRTPDGGFLSLTLDGVVPGIAPVARGFTPFAFTGDLLRYTLTGQEQPGLYTWFSALTVAGTLTPMSGPHQTLFTILPGATVLPDSCATPGQTLGGCGGLP